MRNVELRRSTAIAFQEPAELLFAAIVTKRDRINDSLRFRLRDAALAREQIVFLPLVWPLTMIERQPGFQNAIEMLRSEEQKMVGAFSSHTADGGEIKGPGGMALELL